MAPDYNKYLNQALETIFRPAQDNGFWDEKEGKIIRALKYEFTEDGKVTWSPDDDIKWRYAPFALMGIMEWRTSRIANDKYDPKIKTGLEYFAKKVQDKQVLSQIPSYGIGPLIVSSSLAYKLLHDEKYKNIALDLYKYSIKKFNFHHSEDSLLLYGWSFLYDVEKDSNLAEDISTNLECIIKKQNDSGLLTFENQTTKRHQNQMYTLWGIGKAIEILGRTEYLPNIERTLDYTIKQRMQSDGALIWEDASLAQRLKSSLIKRIKHTYWGWELLFECHQTFFVNAVFQYYRANGKRNYDKYIELAMDWIFGNNALGKNFAEVSDIGVPMRMMTIKGDMNIDGQKFKGAYEVGSYIIALTNLLIVEQSRGGQYL